MTTPTGQLVTIGGVETLTGKTLTTPTVGDFTNAQHAHSDAASGGTLSSSGAVTRAGGNTVEATTTSITAVDLLSVASLTIGATSPIMVWYNGRKTSGAAAAGRCGLKLNATVVAEADAGVGTRGYSNSGASNQAEDGGVIIYLGPRLTNYTGFAHGRRVNKVTATGAVESSNADLDTLTTTAVLPTAQITDVIIRGITGSTSITLALDEMHAYSWAVS